MTRVSIPRFLARSTSALAAGLVALTLGACGSTDTNGTMDTTPGTPSGSDAGTSTGNSGSGSGANDAGDGLDSGPKPVPGHDGGSVDPADAGPGPGPGPVTGGGKLPAPTGSCPDLAAGSVTFSPAGIAPRAVQLYMTDAAKQKHGPLVFYWHGTGSQPTEAQYALGATINAITAAGGIVAAPSHDSNAGQFQWYLVSGTKDDDLRLADEVAACAMQKVGIDAAHVHSMGMSAGGLMTSQMSFRRSSYLASVVTFSGGISPGTAPAYQDASNKFGAMIFFGGPNDNVYNFDFQASSNAYKAKLVADGHFAFLCNHGRGHMVPTDAAASVWQFFQAHPFGTNPSPYAGGLPQGFPTYCSL
jgi:predicted esterase